MLLDLLFLLPSSMPARVTAGIERGAPAKEVGTLTARVALQGAERGAPADTTDAFAVRVALQGAERGAPAKEVGVLSVWNRLSGADRGASAATSSVFGEAASVGTRSFFGREQAAAAQQSNSFTAFNGFRGNERGAPASSYSSFRVRLLFSGSERAPAAEENMLGKGGLASTISRVEYEALETCVRAEKGYITVFVSSTVPSTVVARLVRLGFIALKEDIRAKPAPRFGYVATSSGKTIYLDIKHRRESLGDQGYNYAGVP